MPTSQSAKFGTEQRSRSLAKSLRAKRKWRAKTKCWGETIEHREESKHKVSIHFTSSS